MDDFETHPAGTADLVARLRDWTEYDEGKVNDTRHEAADRIEQLEAALTRANAATAAAYEVAARLFDDGNSVTGAAIGRCVRALATPDQTAALDRLIAEAVKPYLEALIWCSGSLDFNEGGIARKGWQKLCAPLILAASKKGGV